MPFKNFVSGEVLTSSDVNTYLMSQVIIRCTSVTRPASPAEGWHIYETDSQRFMVYRSGVWAPEGIEQSLVVKSADESLTNNAVLQNDDHLVLPVAANARYLVRLMLRYTGTANTLFQWAFSAPSGSAFTWLATYRDYSSGALNRGTALISESAIGHGSANQVATSDGILITAGSSGNLQTRWAQWFQHADTTTVQANHSYLLIRRVG